MTSPLVLPAELTIYTAAELRGPWLAWIDALPAADAAEGAACDADGGAVDTVDACGVQLLFALAGAAAARQRTLRIADPSPALRAACEALGASALVEANETTGAAA